MICKRHGKLDPKDYYMRTDQGRNEVRCRLCSREYIAKSRERKLASVAETAIIPAEHSKVLYLKYQTTTLEPDEIVKLGNIPVWRRWGFSTSEKATEKLVYMWRTTGLPQRNGNTFGRRVFEGSHTGSCTQCKGDLEDRTTGCKRCSDRMRYREKRGLPYIMAHHGKAPANREG